MAEEGRAAARRWFVYVLRCADGTLYTGSTTNVEKRLRAHNEGTGAKYTRQRRPCTLIYSEPSTDKSAALRREAAIKKLSRAEKLHLIEAGASRRTEEH